MRKQITEDEKTEVIVEATIILNYVHDRFTPSLHIYRLPSFIVEFGGHTAYYAPQLNIIKLNYYSWRKMKEAQKRILIIHEYLHRLGGSHNPNYQIFNDHASYLVYLKVYGNDRYLSEIVRQCEYFIEDVKRNVPLINNGKKP